MTKAFLSLLIVAGFGTAAQAQVRLGIKAGAGLATYANTVTAAKSIVTPHGGVTLNAPITSDGFFSVQPELLYSQKGVDFGDLTGRLHYIDLPVLARINADGLIFEAGPQLGYLAGAKSKQETSTGTVTNSSTNGLRKLDIGYIAGVGYQLSSGPNIGLRYNGGFLSVPDSDNISGFRNSVFQLFVGYTFSSK